MKTAVIKITDEQTGESREFPIPDDHGLVTFFTTFLRGSRERLSYSETDSPIEHSLEETQQVIVQAREYFWP